MCDFQASLSPREKGGKGKGQTPLVQFFFQNSSNEVKDARSVMEMTLSLHKKKNIG